MDEALEKYEQSCEQAHLALTLVMSKGSTEGLLPSVLAARNNTIF